MQLRLELRHAILIYSMLVYRSFRSFTHTSGFPLPRISRNHRLLAQPVIAGVQFQSFQSYPETRYQTLGMKRPHPHSTLASATSSASATSDTKEDERGNPQQRNDMENKERKPLVIVIAGPTGAGKSDVAALLCKPDNAQTMLHSTIGGYGNIENDTFVGHIVSADSVQAYEGVSIGANKPTEQERQETQYHLVDVVPAADVATQPYSAATWMHDALQIIDDLSNPTRDAILESNNNSIDKSFTLPVVVGGTMMYLQWLVHGRPNAPKPSSEVVQQALAKIEGFQNQKDEDKANTGWEGATEFVSNLGDVFRQRVAKLGNNDWYRLRRVYEIALTATAPTSNNGKPLADADLDHLFNDVREGGMDSSDEYDVRCFFLCPSHRMNHTKVIDSRCEQMLMKGLLKETSDLYLKGQLPLESQPARAIGYRQALEYLQRTSPVGGDVKAFDKFVDVFTAATRQYAKKQMQWFRRDAQFVFVPVPTTVGSTQSKEERNTKTAEAIVKLCCLPRSDYDKELIMPPQAGSGSKGKHTKKHDDAEMSNSARMKQANEAQGQKMKFYRGERFLLQPNSNELAHVMKEADECTARMQDLQELPLES
jgi:tRNA dimethylallyltransferase